MDAVSRPVEPGDAGYKTEPQRTTDSRYSGYVIEHQGVRIRFNRHRYAMVVLNQYPEAKVVV